MAWNPNVPTITNRVQDDLNAIRENFQHLDQLAERVDELQTVSELAPIANDLQAVSGLAQAVDELQAVSGLASVVEELQTVSGLAPVTGGLQAVSELAPYVQALLDSRIVEHNLDVPNPPTGYYVRYACGLQICWHRWEQEPLEPSSVQVDRKQSGVDVQFPAAFAVAPAADISQEPAFWRDASYGADNSGSSSLSAEVSNGDAITNTRIRFSYDLRTFRGRVQFSYKAIGVWK